MAGPAFEYVLPLEDWIQIGVEWVVDHWRPFFQAVRWPIEQTLDGMEGFLLDVPFPVFLVTLGLLAWRAAGWRVAAFSVSAMFFIGLIGLWDQSMTTLAMIFTALVFNVAVGVPLGLTAGRNDRFWSILRPVLDVMQTTPSFVYLVPVVMLFGVGTVPGVIATIIFSVAPVIRMTNLGVRQVPVAVVEAGQAFGATGWQLLRDIQMPLALSTIMAGLNQTLLLGMVMGTIASMIGAEGLGLTVLRGIGRLDVGLAAIGGLSIVLMAMVLDRITQALGQPVRHAGPQARTFSARLKQAVFGTGRIHRT
ncbi:MAG: proline/glycine betaine ABC transporter permease [Thiotrichales bacterium]|nr:proline/glycine betaine ABC transporter permease [Thiotrichales bacterium]